MVGMNDGGAIGVSKRRSLEAPLEYTAHVRARQHPALLVPSLGRILAPPHSTAALPLSAFQ